MIQYLLIAILLLWLFPGIRRRVERAIGRIAAIVALGALVLLVVIVTVQPI